jgi:hypothetical protein
MGEGGALIEVQSFNAIITINYSTRDNSLDTRTNRTISKGMVRCKRPQLSKLDG